MLDAFSSSQLPKSKWGWVAAVGVSIAAVVLAQLIVAIVVIALGWDVDNLNSYQTYIVAGLSVALPIPILYRYLIKKKARLSDLGLGPKPSPFIKPLVKALGLYILTTVVALVVLQAVAPNVNLDETQDLGLGNDPTAIYQYVSLFVLLVVLTPLSEEMLFRGFMLKGLANRFGWVTAAVVSSLLFGLAHGQLNVGIDTAIMGWYSAGLIARTGSLWPSIALHASKNAVAFTLVFLGPLVS